MTFKKLRKKLNVKGKPKQMIVYLCGKCGFKFGRTEQHVPRCSYCNASKGFKIVKKEPLTPKAIAERLKESTDNMMNAFIAAFGVKPKEVDENEMLQVMQKAKELKDKVQGLSLKKLKKNK